MLFFPIYFYFFWFGWGYCLFLVGNELKLLPGVGKTAIAQRFVQEVFMANTESTVGASYFTKRLYSTILFFELTYAVLLIMLLLDFKFGIRCAKPSILGLIPL